MIERANFLLEVQSFSKSSSGWQFESICTEILKFITAPIEDINIDIIRNTLTAYPMMLEARINSLKTLCYLLTDLKDPLDTLNLLVPMSHTLGEVPHIMCNSRTRKPLNEQYMNLLQCMAQIIQNCRSHMFSMVGKNEEKMDESSNLKHVENAEQVIAYNAETNYARVMLISYILCPFVSTSGCSSYPAKWNIFKHC